MGVALYVSAWTMAGFVLSRWLKEAIGWVEQVGHVTAGLLVLIVVLYVLWLVVSSLRDTKFSAVERVEARDLFERLRTATHDRLVIIADVRSHGYYDPGMQRIKNSIRVEPHRLKEELEALREFMAPECEIYLYCSCIRDTTSVRVAHMLQQENCQTRVIEGGMKAWVKAGGAVELVPEADVQRLPRFE
jgi:rhodanese-related sulfurtransferase